MFTCATASDDAPMKPVAFASCLLMLIGCPDTDDADQRDAAAQSAHGDADASHAQQAPTDAGRPILSRPCADDASTCVDRDPCGPGRYRCNPVCGAMGVFAGGGRSFGECEGECRFEVSIEPSIVLDVEECWAPHVWLSAHDTAGVVHMWTADLSDSAWQQAASITATLTDAAIAPVTGCPDCADGGDAWVVRAPGGREAQEFHYEYGRPPSTLSDADAFLQRLIDQVRVCRGDMLSTCMAQTPDASPDGPSCGTGEVSATSCSCPGATSLPTLMLLEGKPCDAACGGCNVPSSTCGATCTDRCDASSPVWSVWCTE
jgi:hypothetical protein